jgi:hypothetical protein
MDAKSALENAKRDLENAKRDLEISLVNWRVASTHATELGLKCDENRKRYLESLDRINMTIQSSTTARQAQIMADNEEARRLDVESRIEFHPFESKLIKVDKEVYDMLWDRAIRLARATSQFSDRRTSEFN